MAATLKAACFSCGRPGRLGDCVALALSTPHSATGSHWPSVMQAHRPTLGARHGLPRGSGGPVTSVSLCIRPMEGHMIKPVGTKQFILGLETVLVISCSFGALDKHTFVFSRKHVPEAGVRECWQSGMWPPAGPRGTEDWRRPPERPSVRAGLWVAGRPRGHFQFRSF